MSCDNKVNQENLPPAATSTNTTVVGEDILQELKAGQLDSTVNGWDLEKSIVFETLSGSRLYGTNTPESDIDRRGVCLPPAPVILDLFNHFEQKDKFPEEDDDRVIYSLAKFFQLSSECNPNIIELLFSPEQARMKSSPIWEEIMANRPIFLSKKAGDTFLGYAVSQLQRIELHRRWILNPPARKPLRSDYGLSDKPNISASHMNAILALPLTHLRPEIREEAEKEKAYREEKAYWDNYDNWQKNRNPARFEIEQKYHYDCKHGMHLIRLITEGEELLLTGNIAFPRPDAAELLAIRNGKYTYEELMAKVDSLKERMLAAKEKSILPKQPNIKKINQLYFNLVSKYCFNR